MTREAQEFQQERLIELNFGPSEYGPIKHSPPDLKILIPENGLLPELPKYTRFLDFKEVEPIKTVLKPQKTHKFFQTVLFDLFEYSGEGSRKIIMPWIDERGEWVVIGYRRWLESSTAHDEAYSGPYQLNDYCVKKLMQVYAIPPDRLSSQEIVRMKPGELAKIGSEQYT